MSKKKIWSVPIAALALALMIVGGLLASSVVQAQSTGTKTITGIGNSYHPADNTLGIVTTITAIALADGELDTANPNATPPTFNEAIVGYGLSGGDSSLFTIGQTGGDSGLVKIKDAASLATIKDASEKAVYTFDVLVYVDNNTAVDSGRGVRDAGDTTDNPDQPGDTGAEDQGDDRDEVNRGTVTVHFFKFDRSDKALNFASTPSIASSGDRVLGLIGEKKDITVNGVPSAGKVTVTSTSTVFEAHENGNKFYLKYKDGYNETGGIPALNATADRTTTALFTVTVDPDGAGSVLGIPLQIATATIELFEELELDTVPETVGEGQSLISDGSAAKPYVFRVRSNATASSQVGVIGVSGAREEITTDGGDVTSPGEIIDVISSDSSVFKAVPRKPNGSYNQIVIQAKSDLTAADVGTHNFVLTVNGASSTTRTVQGHVSVVVTASNPAPDVDDDDLNSDGELEISVVEDAKNKGNILLGMVDGKANRLHDFSTNVTDDNDLTYTEDSGQFEFEANSGWLVPSANIAASTLVSGTSGATAMYERPDGDGGKFLVNGALADKTSVPYDNVVYEFDVTVADAANSVKIPVVLTINVNKPVGVSSTYVKDTEYPYKTTDPQNHEIVDLATLLSGSDSPLDGIKYVMTVTPMNPPFGLFIDTANNNEATVNVNYPGPSSQTDTWTVKVMVGDAFDNGIASECMTSATVTTPPAYCTQASLPNGVDAVLDFTIKQNPGPPLQSVESNFTIAENSPAGTVVGTLNVTDATRYTVISGTGGARNDFAIASSTGVITVVNPRDYDAANAENNVVLLADAYGNNGIRLAAVIASIAIQDIDEDPMIAAIAGSPYVSENAQIGSAVQTMPTGNGAGSSADPATVISATDPEGRTITYSITDAVKPPFAINASTGALTVSGALDAETTSSHSFTVMAADPAGNSDTIDITVNVNNANEAPRFTSPTGDAAVKTIPEDTGSSTVIFTFTATDEDGDDLVFNLREGQSEELFEIKNTGSNIVNGVEVWSGDLHAKAGVLDYEDASYDSRVHVEVNDPQGQNDTLLLTVNLGNLNDEAPTWDATPKTELTVAENTPRGKVLANYAASDPDNLSAGIAYSLTGANAKSFQISSTGDLATLESIDHDSATPCSGNVCNITVNANDGAQSLATDVRITVVDGEDSVSTLDIRKANPVPGPNAGLADSALSGAKTTMNKNVAERPADLPATLATYDLDNDGTPDNITNAVNFVETQWANWGTVLLIEITSESPDANCGNGNQCVVVALESDSADDKLSVIAYRSAHEEDKFLAAVKLVGRSASSGDGPVDPGYLMPTDHNAPGGIRPRDLGATPGETPVYKHTDGSVARLQVDEEDEVNIAFDNLRDSIDVENDPPEIESFAPPHESAFDDADVDYSFRVTDGLSGIPSAEDLPDNDGDEDYIPVIAIVSQMQCERPEVSVGNGRTIRADVAQCNDKRGIHEYDATKAARSDWGYIAVREDKDFDDIDNGYEVETTLVLDEDKVFYVTFVAVDRAGNMTYFDPDGSDDDVEYAEIVIDVGDPQLYEARTGVTWDEGDEEYDDNRSVIQVIFNDLTPLNPATVETDDFVVEGHTVVAVNVYEQPDDWTDTSRYSSGGELRYRNADGLRLRQSIETSVFLHLQDELQADETPDVTLVPNGIEDVAGNEQDDGEAEADDWISPAFTVVSIVSPRETTENPDKVLAGDDDEVVFNVTVDERLSTARPTVTVSYVDASMVDTKGTSTCDNGDGDSDKHDGKRKRGEITMNTSGETSELCADNNLATDHNLKTTIEKVTNTEWIVTVGEPKGTGYYNFHIAGKDRSAQQNPGSEGVNPDKIVTDFYDADGDVNVDDAVYYEGDINLPKPNVRLGGISITDNEPSVEYRSRLFLEIDFTRRYEDAVACDNMPSLSDTYRLANCMNENSEYSEDSFDDVVITSFVLDGVDITDSVKTTDDQTFLVTLENIGLGDHEVEIQAVDQAGNDLEDTLEIDFEVSDRDPFEKRLSPGWNLISLPGEPADSSIASVIGPNVEVRTVYTYNPVVPGGWQVAVRETLDSEWQGDLTEITGQRGYWVLSDAIQDWEVNIPRLAGGAVGTGTPIQPPVIPLYAGWNLIPVTDVKGNALDHNTPISAAVYLQSLEDGIEAARVLGFDTIRNEWYTVLDGDMMSPGMGTNLLIGSGYWVFVRKSTALVPGGVASSASSD